MVSLSPEKELIWKSDEIIWKNIIANVLIFTLLVCSFVLAPASASERPIFEKMPDAPNFIVSKGTMPEITNETEWAKWSASVMGCWAKMTDTSPSYSMFGNAITNIIPAEDFLIVEIGSNYTNITNLQIDEIYSKINLFCEQEGIRDIPVTFQWQEGTRFPLPDYGPAAIENARKDPLFISSKGTVPVIEDNEEKWEWFNRLGQCYPDVNWFRPYIRNGPVRGFEPSYNGYLIIRLDAGIPEEVNESLIDEIYQRLEAQCQKEGISEVPVVFFWQPVDPNVIYVDENGQEIPEVDENTSDILIKESEENKTEQQAPGFTSVMLFLSLLLLTVKKKKQSL